ncbi:MAG: bifunctional folylpolyglutamate synthase/dihydrofolate synthase [Clostridiales bacterium]|nr:bifunctional folylpolyglutamate synthase/dihydrofolate synthase [Clostridiales bacterium]
MTYDEAMNFIKEAEKLGSIPGLKSITELMSILDDPQDRLQVIHVAGTNGKGSTISFLSSILAMAGYRVGIFISPVVFSYNEKLQIISKRDRSKEAEDLLAEEHANSKAEDLLASEHADSQVDDLLAGEHANNEDEDLLVRDYISREDICNLIDIIKPACEDMVRCGHAHPTAFEIETAMAFLYFDYKKVDFLLLETGMGGRLDSTNVIKSPICSIITPVSYDHMQYLGNSLGQIAHEKAGIMKANSYVITSKQQAEVSSVFHHKAIELKIPLKIADDGKACNIRYRENYTEFEYPMLDKFVAYKIRILGSYQINNAILALETARMLNEHGYIVGEEDIKKGLWQAKWHGRFELISKEPDIYIDGAHNEEAAYRLRDSIEIYFTNRRLIFMIGVLADKDYQNMLGILASMADTIITLTPDNHRALASNLLAKEAEKYCSKVICSHDMEDAIRLAYKEAEPEDVIIAFGSLSFLGTLAAKLRMGKDESNNG